jgi:hypothetical protein
VEEKMVEALRELIEPFVRGELGCECPDEVFSDIRVVQHPAAWSALPVDYALEIGGRLLVVVCLPDRWSEAATCLPELIRKGIQARDRGGFNRIRLVLPTSNRGLAEQALDARFSELAAKEPKLHLHIVGLAGLPAIATTKGSSPSD